MMASTSTDERILVQLVKEQFVDPHTATADMLARAQALQAQLNQNLLPAAILCYPEYALGKNKQPVPTEYADKAITTLSRDLSKHNITKVVIVTGSALVYGKFDDNNRDKLAAVVTSSSPAVLVDTVRAAKGELLHSITNHVARYWVHNRCYVVRPGEPVLRYNKRSDFHELAGLNADDAINYAYVPDDNEPVSFVLPNTNINCVVEIGLDRALGLSLPPTRKADANLHLLVSDVDPELVEEAEKLARAMGATPPVSNCLDTLVIQASARAGLGANPIHGVFAADASHDGTHPLKGAQLLDVCSKPKLINVASLAVTSL